MKDLNAIDLFAGAGGLSEGFRQAGFTIAAATDFDPASAFTFQENHPETPFLKAKVESLSARDLLKAGNLHRNELDVLLGGPPCQAFSVYNHQRGMQDERSGLFREYLRMVKEFMPRFVVMENVTGIMSVDDGVAVTEIHKRLKELGYYVEHRVLHAEEYGIPQERRRLFFIGSRDGEYVDWPEPTHLTAAAANDLFESGKGPGLKPFVTVGDAISDLPALAISEGEEVAAYRTPPQSPYQKLLRKGSRKVFNHVAPFLAEINLKRLKHIPQGGSWRDIPHRLLPAGMKLARRSDHTKRYGRLHPDGLSSTILTKCDLHWGAFIHPTQQRCLTVREAARFQSFPDRIRFHGSRGDQFRQVGNAVPPLLSRAVAVQIQQMVQGVGANAKAKFIGV